MRIISWNSRGQYIKPEELVEALNRLGADALVIQEAHPTLTVSIQERDGIKTRNQPTAPKGLTWTIEHFQGGAQDKYAIAYRKGITLKLKKIYDDPRKDGLNKRRYLIVQLEASATDSVVLATCHAPYIKKGSTEPKEYMTDLFEALECQVDPIQASVRIFMGDTNLHDIGAADDVKPTGWTCTLKSPTGKGEEAHPLDRIYVRGNISASKYACGRICVKHAPDASREDKGTIKDHVIPEDSSPCSEVWTKGDHWPIYFDSNGKSPSPPKDDESVTTSREKRGRSATADLFELVDGEKAAKQKQKQKPSQI